MKLNLWPNLHGFTYYNKLRISLQPTDGFHSHHVILLQKTGTQNAPHQKTSIFQKIWSKKGAIYIRCPTASKKITKITDLKIKMVSL